MMNDGLRIHAQRNFAREAIELYVFQRTQFGKTAQLTNIEFTDIPEEFVVERSPLLLLNVYAAQALMDDLWNAGVRPTDTRDRSDVINAKDAHIKDLQRMIDRLMAHSPIAPPSED